jgi:hypothetical protein
MILVYLPMLPIKQMFMLKLISTNEIIDVHFIGLSVQIFHSLHRLLLRSGRDTGIP